MLGTEIFEFTSKRDEEKIFSCRFSYFLCRCIDTPWYVVVRLIYCIERVRNVPINYMRAIKDCRLDLS